MGDMCQTVVVACVSATLENCQQTLNTLRYAEGLKKSQGSSKGKVRGLLKSSLSLKHSVQVQSTPCVPYSELYLIKFLSTRSKHLFLFFFNLTFVFVQMRCVLFTCNGRRSPSCVRGRAPPCEAAATAAATAVAQTPPKRATPHKRRRICAGNWQCARSPRLRLRLILLLLLQPKATPEPIRPLRATAEAEATAVGIHQDGDCRREKSGLLCNFFCVIFFEVERALSALYDLHATCIKHEANPF